LRQFRAEGIPHRLIQAIKRLSASDIAKTSIQPRIGAGGAYPKGNITHRHEERPRRWREPQVGSWVIPKVCLPVADHETSLIRSSVKGLSLERKMTNLTHYTLPYKVKIHLSSTSNRYGEIVQR
jgi:hypothetical protein